MNKWTRRTMTGLLGAAAFGLAALGLAGGAEAQVTGGGWARACVGTYGGVRIVLPPNTACVTGETPFAVFGGRLVGGRFLDLGLTVLDTRTGLQWEKKTGAGAGADPNNLHDVDNTYNWCDATGGTGDLCSPPALSWITAVNGQNFAGHSDWRVPTREELESILLVLSPPTSAHCPSVPCIDPIFGPTQPASYWSATTPDSGNAWSVYFGNGFTTGNNKVVHLPVRAVRTGP
jgi:hypothetical protein